MTNIEIFNIAVGEIFGRCYAEFPVKIQVSCTEIAMAVAECYDEKEIMEREDLIQKEAEIVFDAVDWLVKAGYLWTFSGDGDLDYHGVTLTPKGLEVMNSVPASLQTKESLGQLFSKGIKSLGSEAVTEAVKLSLAIGAKTVGA
jgi:hypothetical protein